MWPHVVSCLATKAALAVTPDPFPNVLKTAFPVKDLHMDISQTTLWSPCFVILFRKYCFHTARSL